MGSEEYNRILKILDILRMDGIDVIHIASEENYYTLGASQYSFKVTEFLQKEKCNFMINHKDHQHDWIISTK